MPRRYVTAEPLHVSSDLMGQPLASPWRRAVALAVDGAVLAIPSVLLAVLLAAAGLRFSDPRGFAALWQLMRGEAGTPAAAHQVMRDLAPMLTRIEAPGLPPAVAHAVEEGRLDEAARRLSGVDLMFLLSYKEHADAPPPGRVLVPIERFIPGVLRVAALYGIAALYFTLLTSGRRGATLGKRLLGLRVARLDGEPLHLLESLERFVGYLHIPGSLGLSLLYLWIDPLRRQPHDRVANTVVVQHAKAAQKPAA